MPWAAPPPKKDHQILQRFGEMAPEREIKFAPANPQTVEAGGTPHRAARFLEFGTPKMRARPFLWPVFPARLPRIKHDLTNTLRARWAKR